jgi:arylsulfatase A-like enzyme
LTSDNGFGGKSGAISRRDALRGLSGVAAATALPRFAMGETAAPSPAISSKQPNILWITGEGVPTRALSCYGSQLMKTPNIDRIANEGMRFENAFCTNALCAPSRATLLTGTYSHVNGMLGNPDAGNIWGNAPPRFDVSLPMLPKILRQHGYQTGMVGKWHLEPATPAQAGFDYFVYKTGAGGPYYSPTGYLGNEKLGSEAIKPFRYDGYGTDVMTDLAIRGMQEFRQPFVMMVQYFNAHRPFDPPHKYEHLYDQVRIPEPGTFWDDYSHRAGPARAARMRIENMPDFRPPANLTGRQRKQWNYQRFMEHFLGTLRSQDDNIGRLFEFLEKNGLLENTIVVYTTDHGFFLGDHGWFDKRFMYEEALRVPWMIRYPGKVKSGSVRTEWTVNVDNAPTVLDLLGLPIPEQMQGKSLLPLLNGGPPPPDWRSSMYYHYYEFGPPHWVAPHYGIRTDKFKLIDYYTENQWELFDLDKDPDEMESQFGEQGAAPASEYADIAHQLVDQLRQIRENYRDTSGAPVRLWPFGD